MAVTRYRPIRPFRVLAWPDVQSLPFVIWPYFVQCECNLELLESLGKKGCKTLHYPLISS